MTKMTMKYYMSFMMTKMMLTYGAISSTNCMKYKNLNHCNMHNMDSTILSEYTSIEMKRLAVFTKFKPRIMMSIMLHFRRHRFVPR
jgi:hypothetical protein